MGKLKKGYRFLAGRGYPRQLERDMQGRERKASRDEGLVLADEPEPLPWCAKTYFLRRF